jgi:hypothetical protein
MMPAPARSTTIAIQNPTYQRIEKTLGIFHAVMVALRRLLMPRNLPDLLMAKFS